MGILTSVWPELVPCPAAHGSTVNAQESCRIMQGVSATKMHGEASIDASEHERIAYLWDGKLRYRKAQSGGRGPDRWYTTGEIAALMRVCVATVRGWIKRGLLTAHKVPADPRAEMSRVQWRVRGRDLEVFLSDMRGAGRLAKAIGWE